MEKKNFHRETRVLKTKHGHECNMWCGSCAFKEIQAKLGGGSAEGLRWCTMLNKEVELDDLCEKYKMDDKIAQL